MSSGVRASISARCSSPKPSAAGRPSPAATVGLTELSPDHPFAHGQATDNIVRFTTARYRERPLVVQGPGAGPEVTAAGVFADLLRITAALGVSP